MLRQRYIVACLLFVALFVVFICYPYILGVAKKYSIVDSPNIRKTQRRPIPVLGGVASYIGILTGIGIGCFFFDPSVLGITLGAISFMLFIGVCDDIWDISPGLRFLFELFLIYAVMVLSGRFIDDLHGVWGIDVISLYFSIPLSIIAGVGIINAINMIDGVNGYCSGYCMLACAIFGIFFICAGMMPMGCIAFISMGALIPFFLHNVFGKDSLMFLGDGGSLMIGMLMTSFVFNAISSLSDAGWLDAHGLCVVPFTLAVLSIPVFDTLRVMMTRIIHNRSPFLADRTHLHHAFLDYGFSHLGTTFVILSEISLIVLCWFVSWRLHLSADVQLYVVVLLSVLFVWGQHYLLIRECKKPNRSKMRDEIVRICDIVDNSSVSLFLRRLLDRAQ